jgi:AAA family ATP:ADP antiporter
MHRILRQFIDIRRNEVEPAALFFLLWFCIILVFQVLKPLKKGLFVDSLGAYLELYAKLANVGIAVLAVICFTALYNRFGSRKLIGALCGFFVLALLGFALWLGERPSAAANWSFYLFGDAWSTVWVTTFWAYLNELTETEQSKRLYGLIGGGGVVGGLLGGLVVWSLVRPIGAPSLLAACATLTVLIGVMVWRIESVAARPGSAVRRRAPALGMDPPEMRPNAAIEGARLVLASKYLLAITAIVFVYELVSQILDYQYSSAAEALEGTGATQAFFGQVTAIIGVVSVLTQLLLVSFIIRRFSLTAALLVLPVAMAVSSSIYLLIPVLWAAALLTISDNSFSYSIHQTARETLYMPMSPDVKYKARAFANMFVQRLGKGVAILAALALAAIPVRFLSLVALLFIAVWIWLALYAGRQFDVLASAEERARRQAA